MQALPIIHDPLGTREKGVEGSQVYRISVRRQRAFFKGHPERSWHFDGSHWFSRNGVALRTNDDP
jgi:hypothetical protein